MFSYNCKLGRVDHVEHIDSVCPSILTTELEMAMWLTRLEILL